MNKRTLDEEADKAVATELRLALRADPLPADVEARIAERLRAGLRRRQVVQLHRAERAEWIRWAPGVRLRVLRHEPEARRLTAIWQLDAGASIPPHPHDADEECLVLEGDMRHENEHFAPGDYMIAPAGSAHHRITSTGGCRMLIRGSDLPLRMQMA